MKVKAKRVISSEIKYMLVYWYERHLRLQTISQARVALHDNCYYVYLITGKKKTDGREKLEMFYHSIEAS